MRASFTSGPHRARCDVCEDITYLHLAMGFATGADELPSELPSGFSNICNTSWRLLSATVICARRVRKQIAWKHLAGVFVVPPRSHTQRCEHRSHHSLPYSVPLHDAHPLLCHAAGPQAWKKRRPRSWQSLATSPQGLRQPCSFSAARSPSTWAPRSTIEVRYASAPRFTSRP